VPAARSLRRIVVVLTLWLCCAAAACASEPRVVLHTTGGDVAVAVEVAATPAEQAVGLMYRKTLGERNGMLFVFPSTTEHSFWMKNTILPLDMIFLGEDRRVVGIVEHAVPFTTTPRTVGVPSRYVLEVNAGFSAAHGVKTGDQATFERVSAAP
jgi:uncharacterized membrane protein (UPF0127 family)